MYVLSTVWYAATMAYLTSYAHGHTYQTTAAHGHSLHGIQAISWVLSVGNRRRKEKTSQFMQQTCSRSAGSHWSWAGVEVGQSNMEICLSVHHHSPQQMISFTLFFFHTRPGDEVKKKKGCGPTTLKPVRMQDI